MKDLPLSRRQIVEIAKALARDPRILILDEATSALTAADVTKVYAVLKRLRSEGLALVYISHRMHEIAELADDCTVFRNGRNVATYAAGTKIRRRNRGADDRARIHARVSAKTQGSCEKHCASARSPQPVLDTPAERYVARCATGEVVGLGGLDGQGQRELLLALFGVLRGVTGEVLIDGKPVRLP